MKKVLTMLLTVVMIMGMFPCMGIAVESLSDPLIFTWAWNANKIDTDNSLTVVSWTGGSYSSYRSGFIVYDLPEDFSYTSIKTEVIASFAINKATLNNGTSQAPTAAVVMVDGDKVKDAYNLKSGSSATALLNEAKASGVLLGTYKIGQYPRTSRIKNTNINAFFEKHPDVKSIGFYVTNLSADGYADTVNGIASAMTDVEVNFTAYQNYANATVKMIDSDGNVLDTLAVRDEIGTAISVPETVDKDGIIWVRDTAESYILSDSSNAIEVTYRLDKGDREKYVAIIEENVSALVENPVSEKINLPTGYVTEDDFVINIQWTSTDEAVVSADGTVYPGTNVQTAQIYANVWIGEYTSVETKKFTVTVNPVNQGETDRALLLEMDFTGEVENRGNFNGEKVDVSCTIGDEYTIAAYIRCDDLTDGGTIFNISGIECSVNPNGSLAVGEMVCATLITEGEWYHLALTNSALYINGEKVADVDSATNGSDSYIGAYSGKMDNFCVYSKAFSQSVIESLMDEDYDSPSLEVVSASVVEGLDGVVVKLSAKGYKGEVFVFAYSALNGVRHAGSKIAQVEEGLNVFSVNIPNMGGKATKENTYILVWDNALVPLFVKHDANRSYDFGFNYTHPDNHMLSNTFTLMGKNTGLYLTSNGLSQRADDGYWSAPYIAGTNTEGYYSLKNRNGSEISGNWTFEQVEDNVYKIRNRDTGEYLSYGINDEWVLNITQYNEVSKAFASEGFLILSANERNILYSVTGQALWQSNARREKLIEIISGDYYDLDGYSQAERLRELFSYYPSYQINRAVSKSTTGIEANYALSDITWTTYSDMDGYTKNGYTAAVTYSYEEGDVTVAIYARSQNVVKNIAKGFSYMPYQFIKPLKTVIDYNASNNQFKAETGVIYIETNYEVSSENVAITGAHELGHLIDFAGYRMSMGDYRTARENECAVSGYGETALNEDFAEFCQFVISCNGDSELLRQVKAMFPGRYSALCDGMCEMYGECILK